MKIIRSQSDLNSLINNGFPNDEMISIYALPNGETYKISQTISLPTNAHIRGVNLPKIEWIADIPTGTVDMISILGTANSTTGTIHNVVVDGLHLIGKTVTGKLNGINMNFNGYTWDGCGVTYILSTNVGATRQGTTIKNCIIENMDTGIRIENSAYCKVLRNKITNCKVSAVYTNSLKVSIISSNLVQDIKGGYSLEFNNLRCSVFKDNTIQKNAGWIHFQMGNTNVISGNSITNNAGGMYIYGSENNSICNNHIVNCGWLTQGAITLTMGSWRNTIYGNVISNCLGDGILIVSYTERTVIVANIIQYCGGVGIKTLADATFPNKYTLLYDNIINRNNGGATVLATGTVTANNINMTTNL